jgi:CDP-diacylglycerol pyrophosphatase
VRTALRLHNAEIGDRWAPLQFPLAGGHRYTAMWVPGERLGANNPFKLLAEGVPGAARNMGDRTLVVIGASRADGTPGFIILTNQVDSRRGELAHGEELQDHACRATAP